MSVSPFRDTVTLWHPIKSGNGEVYVRRIIERVKCVFTEKSSSEDTAVLYIPVFGKRELLYVLPWDFPSLIGAGNVFTVSAGDRFVYGVSSLSDPPEDAMTALAVTRRFSGSRRMHHIEVRGGAVKEKTETDGKGGTE